MNFKFYLALLRFAWQRLVSFAKGLFSKHSIKKTLTDLPVAFREALALHNIFMAFGIPESDIYVAYTDKCFQVVAYQNPPQVLLAQDSEPTANRKEFCVDVADLDLDKDSFVKAWVAAAKIYNNTPHAERVAMVEASQSYKQATLIITQMVTKGFRSEDLDKVIVKTPPPTTGLN